MPRMKAETLEFGHLPTPTEISLTNIEIDTSNLIDISIGSKDVLDEHTEELKRIRRANELILGQEVKRIED